MSNFIMDGILLGNVCEQCGCLIGDGQFPGYSRKCSNCSNDNQNGEDVSDEE